MKKKSVQFDKFIKKKSNAAIKEQFKAFVGTDVNADG